MNWEEINHFEEWEFECPCCKKADMNASFVKLLDKARTIAGVSFVLTSGYRCKKHNDELPHSSPNSSHMKGLAVDITASDSRTRFKILNALLEVGFTRIGVGSSFIHVDRDLSKPQEVIWTY